MKSKKGLVLVLIVLLVVAAGGWYAVMKISANKSNSQLTYKGKQITSANKKFSITIPNGWSDVQSCTDTDAVRVNDEPKAATMTYTEQTEPAVSATTCGGEPPSLFGVTANNANQVEPASPDAKEFTSNAGVTGSKLCEDNVSSQGLVATIDLKRCEYRFEKNDMVYQIKYTRPDDSYPDNTDMIDQVAKSLVII